MPELQAEALPVKVGSALCGYHRVHGSTLFWQRGAAHRASSVQPAAGDTWKNREQRQSHTKDNYPARPLSHAHMWLQAFSDQQGFNALAHWPDHDASPCKYHSLLR